MLKRNIAILIAGGLLSVQAGLAGAQSAIPQSRDITPLLPAQAQYFTERVAVPTKSAAATGMQSTDITRALPAQAKYFAEREAQAVRELRAAQSAKERVFLGEHNADGHMTRAGND